MVHGESNRQGLKEEARLIAAGPGVGAKGDHGRHDGEDDGDDADKVKLIIEPVQGKLPGLE